MRVHNLTLRPRAAAGRTASTPSSRQGKGKVPTARRQVVNLITCHYRPQPLPRKGSERSTGRPNPRCHSRTKIRVVNKGDHLCDTVREQPHRIFPGSLMRLEIANSIWKSLGTQLILRIGQSIR